MLTMFNMMGSELNLVTCRRMVGARDCSPVVIVPGTLKTFLMENSPVMASECSKSAGARLEPKSWGEYGEGLF